MTQRRTHRAARWRMDDGRIVTTDQLKRIYFNKLPSPAQRRMLGITKVAPAKKNPAKPRLLNSPENYLWHGRKAGESSRHRTGDTSHWRGQFTRMKNMEATVELRRLAQDLFDEGYKLGYGSTKPAYFR